MIKKYENVIAENNNNISKRNSSIELLKIIAIFMIILSHSVPFWSTANILGKIDLNLATENIQYLVLLIFRYIGQIGNIIFIISSAYFLQESKKTKANKVFNMIMDTFIVSVMFLISFLLLDYDLSIKEIIKQLFPITFGNNWFIGCYIVYYILHPLLNIIIENVNKKTLLHINMFITIYYICIQFIAAPNYNNIIGFILIYFIVAYFKKYLRSFSSSFKKNIFMLSISILSFISFILIWNYAGCKIDIFSNKMLRFATIINPFCIGIGISIFNLFNNKKFYIKIINYISSLSILIYLIHDNILLREYFKSWYWRNIQELCTYNNISLLVFLTAIGTFFVSIVVAAIYKETIQRIIRRLYNKIFLSLEEVGNKYTDFFMKLS